MIWFLMSSYLNFVQRRLFIPLQIRGLRGRKASLAGMDSPRKVFLNFFSCQYSMARRKGNPIRATVSMKIG
ncbi:MAG: hypothetical protein OWQ55_02585, partial [Sulfuracidifex metallicus]|nr:hypothetical protein [Sulfuracidifex metallicus]